MTRLSPGVLMDRIEAMLRAAPPLGISIDELHKSIGRTKNTIKNTLARMVVAGRAHSFKSTNFARYFATAAARDAAIVALTEQGRQAVYALREASAAKRRGDVADGTSAMIMAALKACAPHGRSIRDLEQQTGKTYTAVKCAVHRLQKSGRASAVRTANEAWYFLGKDGAEAAKKALPRRQKPAKLERAKPYDIQRREHDEQPKPKKAPPTIDWSRAKRTECRPTMAGRQYEIAGHVAGGFVEEWLTLRGLPAAT